jgi:uncharacterized membrane protein
VTDVRLRRASVALCLAGVGIAGYLTYVHYAGLRPICGISRGCETVQTSRYASLVGVPVALLGCSWCVSSAIVFSLMAITGAIRAVRAGGEFSPVAAEAA